MKGLPAWSIFESMRSYGGNIFKLDEHLNRFKESAKTTGIKLSERQISNFKKTIENAYKKSKIKNAYIRACFSPGCKNLSLIIKDIKKYPDEFYQNGVSLRTDVIRKSNNAISHIKSSNFLPCVCAKLKNDEGSFETLVLNENGFVTETTVSNIFIVKDSCIFTAPPCAGLLNGITRQVVFNLAFKCGVKIKETFLTRHDLYNADECFLTNTTIGVMPVTEIDKRKIGNGKPGKTTKNIYNLFMRGAHE